MLALFVSCAVTDFAGDVIETNNKWQQTKGRVEALKLVEDAERLEKKYKKAKREVKDVVANPKEGLKKLKKIHDERCTTDAFGGKTCVIHEEEQWTR